MDVVIFGIGGLSRLAAQLLTLDSPHRPVAFTVHDRFVSGAGFCGLPLHRFEDLERQFPPETVALLAPLGWTRMGGLRADVLAEGKSKGYRFVSYVSSRALTWPGLVIGENSMIFEGAIVEPGASIGDNCIVRSGALLAHDARLGDHGFVAARAVVGSRARIGANCFLGLNSTVRDGIVIAPRCFIAAGAVVNANTQSDGIYRGLPARRSPASIEQLLGAG